MQQAFSRFDVGERESAGKEGAITRLRTRSAAVRHWRDLSLSAYEQDLVTNEKV